MIIIDPVTLGDVAFSRASPKWVFDRTGTLVEVPTNVPAVTYDPSDLSKAPYVLIEPEATNYVLQSEAFDNSSWSKNASNVVANAFLAPDGTNTADFLGATGADSYVSQAINVAPGRAYTFSVWLRSTNPTPISLYIADNGGPPAATGASCVPDSTWRRYSVTRTLPATATSGLFVQIGGANSFTNGENVHAWGAQLEVGSAASSYIKTTSAAVTRPADVVGTTPGLLYSNVTPTEPVWTPGTYALNARVRSGHIVYQSLVADNTAPLTDEVKWKAVGVTAPRAMFDQYNNTQSTAPEEILVVLSPQAIAQGLYLGNVDASEIRVSVVDLKEGVVYSEVQSLISPTIGSSFYNWAFRRIKRSNYFLTMKMPPYAGALVTVAIRKPGGVSKCGMCALGPIDEFGPSLMGLGTEGKDYSSTTFDADGTSSTKIRPYAKRMSVDVSIDNTDIDYVHTRLEELRQRPVVWVGGPYGSTAVFGRYGSFRNVIESYPRSKMALQIEGTV